jgi:hypothetical protein
MLRKTIKIFILIVMFAVTGIVTMSGCSRNQEALTWTEVLSDIRDKYPDVNQLRTDELYSWLTAPDSEPIIIIDTRAKEEFHVSNITGAMNIPYDKDPPGTFHMCRSGPLYCRLLFRRLPFFHPGRKITGHGFYESIQPGRINL